MRAKKYFLVLFVCIWEGSGIVWPYQWPTEPRILSVFGQGGSDGFERGIRISSSSSEVKPIEDGELIFFSPEGAKASLPYPLGSFAVLQHGNILRSLVCPFRSLTEIVKKSGKTTFLKSDELGKTGLTGASSMVGLSLFTYDLEAKQFVNPFLLLPPVKDTSRPIIRNTQLGKKDRIIPLPTTASVPKGTWEVSAEIFDLSAAVPTFWPMGVYKVSLYLNGQERFMVTMDTLKEQSGVTRVYPSEGLSYEQLYQEGFRMKLGTVNLNPGVLNLEIVARDFVGNERNQLYRFRVE